MTSDLLVRDLLESTTPSDVSSPDTRALRAAGTRRRRVKRGAAALGAVTAAALVATAGLAVLPSEPSAPTDVTNTPGSAPAWDELTLDEAIVRLRGALDATGGPAAPPDGDFEVRFVATPAWQVSNRPFELQVHETILRLDPGLSTFRRDPQAAGGLPAGASLEETRGAVAALAPPEDEHFVEGVGEHPYVTGGPNPLAEAEALATGPNPFVPEEGQTERPDRAYALLRLADALRSFPSWPPDPTADEDLLRRGYDVMETLGTDWVEYRGRVTDVLGREAIGFTAYDPAIDTETVLLFDPATGWYLGELEYGSVTIARTLTGTSAVEIVSG